MSITVVINETPNYSLSITEGTELQLTLSDNAIYVTPSEPES